MSVTIFGGRMLVAAALIGAGSLLGGCGEKGASASGSTADPGAVKPPAVAKDNSNTAPATAQTTCPIMAGNKINKSIFVDYKGKRVYFCCGACPAEFNKDPAKYVKAMEDKGIVLDKTPATP